MKKILFIAIVAMASLAACKKDRTCTCVSTNSAPGSTSSTDVFTIMDAKKGDAKKICITSVDTYTVSGTVYTSTSTCTLK